MMPEPNIIFYFSAQNLFILLRSGILAMKDGIFVSSEINHGLNSMIIVLTNDN